jgi:two-component system chemotaxis response regulator CheY
MPLADPIELPDKIPTTVLVVDDDADIRVSIAELLQENGYRVVMAADGQQAFDYLEASPPPACVVLDLWMPVMDGWTLAAQVMNGRLPAVPIVIVTASNANFGYPVPPRYVLRKPFDVDRLLTLVAELIEQNRTAALK